MSQLTNILGGGLARAPQARRAIPPALAQFLSKLSYEDEAAALDRFFGRVPEPSNDLNELAMPESLPEQFAGVDPGLFGGPMVQRMMEEAELRQAVEPGATAPLADMMADMNRRRALERVNLSRLPDGDPRRQLADIARAAEDGISLQRAADTDQAREAERRAQGMGDAISSWSPLIAGGGAAAAVGAGQALFGPEAEEPGMQPFGYRMSDERPPVPPSFAEGLTELVRSLPGSSAWAGNETEDFLSPEVAMDEDYDAVTQEILSGIDGIDMAEEPEVSLESDPFSDAILAAEASEPEGGMRVREGAESIPGLSPDQQLLMDRLVRRGVDPMQALMIVKGQLPMPTGAR